MQELYVPIECCILSKFYIKPQQRDDLLVDGLGCILSKFYIKPQPVAKRPRTTHSCILSKFYIKPQLHTSTTPNRAVVSYRNSTSNHNFGPKIPAWTSVVSYRNSTSNHNSKLCPRTTRLLYLIEILHQTTTGERLGKYISQLYLIEILHQTTTSWNATRRPQRLYLIEILHQTTTMKSAYLSESSLYLIEILHQTTTSGLILIDKVLLTGCLPL